MARWAAAKIRIERHCLRETGPSAHNVLDGASSQPVMPSLQPEVIGFQILRLPPGRRVRFRGQFEGGGDGGGNLLLHREDIGQIAVVTVAPEVAAVRATHQLRRNADAAARALDAAFEQRPHSQPGADVSHIQLFAAKGERRSTGRHPEAVDARERADDLIGQTIAEIFVLLFGAQAGKRQNGDGRRDRRGRRARHGFAFVQYVNPSALPPCVQFRAQCVYGCLGPPGQPAYRQAAALLPADGGADVAAQVPGDLFPGLHHVQRGCGMLRHGKTSK
jgi:hypothetical protein